MKKNLLSIFLIYLSFVKVSLGVVFLDVREGDILDNHKENTITVVSFDLDNHSFQEVIQFHKRNKPIYYTKKNQLYNFEDNIKNPIVSQKPNDYKGAFFIKNDGELTFHQHSSKKNYIIRSFGTIGRIRNEGEDPNTQKKDKFNENLHPSNKALIKHSLYKSNVLEKFDQLHNKNEILCKSIGNYILENGEYIYKEQNIFTPSMSRVKGKLGELALEMTFFAFGYKSLFCKLNGDQGLDGVFIGDKSYDSRTITRNDLYLTESKVHNKESSSEYILEQCLGENSLQRKIKSLNQSSNAAHQETALAIEGFIINNPDQIKLIAHKVRIKIPQQDTDNIETKVKFYSRPFNLNFYNLILQKDLSPASEPDQKQQALTTLMELGGLDEKSLFFLLCRRNYIVQEQTHHNICFENNVRCLIEAMKSQKKGVLKAILSFSPQLNRTQLKRITRPFLHEKGKKDSCCLKPGNCEKESHSYFEQISSKKFLMVWDNITQDFTKFCNQLNINPDLVFKEFQKNLLT